MKNNTTLIDLLLTKQEDCYVFIVKRVKDKQLAEDILQDINYIVIKNQHLYKDRKKPWAYLTTLIKNRIISVKRRLALEYSLFENKEEMYKISPYVKEEDAVILSMTLQEVMDMIKQYGPKITEIFSLVAQGVERKEIAERLDIPLAEIDFIIDKKRKDLRVWRDNHYPKE